LIAATVVMGLLALGACKSSGGSVTSSAEGLKGSPLKLMVIDSQFAVQPFADSRSVATGLANKINTGGGIQGHPLEVDFCSGATDPNTTQQCAEKAINGGYVATVDDFMAADTGASAALADAGVAQLGENPISADAYSCATCFPVNGGAITNVASTLTECH